MTKPLCLASALALSLAFAGTAAIACPGDKAKTAGGEQNMSKPSAKYSKEHQKPGKAVSAETTGAEEKAAKPKV